MLWHRTSSGRQRTSTESTAAKRWSWHALCRLCAPLHPLWRAWAACHMPSTLYLILYETSQDWLLAWCPLYSVLFAHVHTLSLPWLRWAVCHMHSLCSSCPLSIARCSLLQPKHLYPQAHSGCGCHRFGAYNVGGALLWTFMFVGAGFFLGNLPAVKHNFTLVVLGIVAVGPHSVLAKHLHNVTNWAWAGGMQMVMWVVLTFQKQPCPLSIQSPQAPRQLNVSDWVKSSLQEQSIIRRVSVSPILCRCP